MARNQVVARYSTWMPDGRTLAYTPTDPEVFTIDDGTVTEKQAEEAWNAQPADWQRGRTLRAALDYWQGK